LGRNVIERSRSADASTGRPSRRNCQADLSAGRWLPAVAMARDMLGSVVGPATAGNCSPAV